ncbi:MAG: hypothetical protein A4E32_01087 [Methanomassiliicoccales archaeon PtaU1.Bin124]|nr:MAG: hypothetical protein A4E32_01087 [Methanomassiliicoccales archaeon PtaU1.Bin124]
MVIITLIGERQAREGAKFVYRGPQTECRECKLKAVCFNLDAGGQYRIKVKRDVRHECKIHEDGVRVVEVERIPRTVAVNKKAAQEGSTITLEEIRCRNLGCTKYRLCHPFGLEKGMKGKITKVSGDLECPEGMKLVEVVLE